MPQWMHRLRRLPDSDATITSLASFAAAIASALATAIAIAIAIATTTAAYMATAIFFSVRVNIQFESIISSHVGGASGLAR